MFLSKHKRSLGIAGVVLAIIVAICPHGSHGAILEDSCDAGDKHAAAEHSHSDHEHQHCELDSAHSHDFLVRTTTSLRPTLQPVAVVAISDEQARSVCANASLKTSPPDPSQGILSVLATLRLLL